MKFYYIYRAENQQANGLAQMASEYKEIPDDQSFTVLELQEPAYARLEEAFTITAAQAEDWREPIKQFLTNPTPEVDTRIKWQAVRYILIDQQLYRRTEDEVFYIGEYFLSGLLIFGLTRNLVPIWITLPRLPVPFFHKSALFSIARLIGHPLRLDEATTKLKRPSVARIQVEIYVLRDRPEKIWIQMGSKEGYWQKI